MNQLPDSNLIQHTKQVWPEFAPKRHKFQYGILPQYKTLRNGGKMKGYFIEAGYMGYINGGYMLFANEEDYREYYMECGA